MPNQNNLRYIFDRTKLDVDLVDYNIVNGGEFMAQLRKVFGEMRDKGDEMGMGAVARIVNTILSPHYSSATIQILMKGANFPFLLQVQ